MKDQQNKATFTTQWCPDVCPITGRPFFMWITHHKTGVKVPTYGGPFDSYTLPTKGSDGSFECERYDHDRGGWLTDEIQDLGLKLVDDQSFVVEPDHPRYNEIEDFAKAEPALEAPAATEWQVVENTGTHGHAAGFYVCRDGRCGKEWMRDKKRRIACFATHAQALAAIEAEAPHAPSAPTPSVEAPAAPALPADEFRGDTPSLVRNIIALLEMDAEGCLVPHGVGGSARGLLSAAAARLAAAPQAPAAPAVDAPDLLLTVIQRLNQNPYSLTKSECIREVEVMREEAIAEQAAAKGDAP